MQRSYTQLLDRIREGQSWEDWAADYVVATGANVVPLGLLRDVLASLKPPFGSMYVSSSAETTIATKDVFVKVAGTTAAVNLMNFDMPSDNRLRYLGSSPRHMHVACSIGMTAAANNQITHWRIIHYDASEDSTTQLVHSDVQRKVGTATDIGSTALHCDVMMGENDYLELWVSNGTGTANITCDYMYMFALGMII